MYGGKFFAPRFVCGVNLLCGSCYQAVEIVPETMLHAMVKWGMI